MPVEEGPDLRLVLLRQQRTRSVDQTPAGPHEIAADRKNSALLGHNSARSAEIRTKSCIGVAPPCACPGTGRIHQDAIELSGPALRPSVAGLSRWRSTLSPRPGAAAHRPSSRGTETSQAVIRPRFRMAAASARVFPPPRHTVGNPHARPGIGQQGDQLAALILHLDQPFEERPGLGHRPALTPQAPWRQRRRYGYDPLGGQGGDRRLARPL